MLGRSFTVKDSSAGADAARRRVVVKAKETASAAPVPDVGSGGELVIETDGASQTLPLPAAGWRISGTGVKYVDSQTVNGAVKTVVIRRSARGTFTMKAVLTGAHAPLDLVPPIPARKAPSPSCCTRATSTARISVAWRAVSCGTTARGAST